MCLEKGVKPGMQISNDELLALIAESDFRRAKSKALWLISRRSFCQNELQSKLKSDYGDIAANKAASRMADLALVNDEEYAARLASQLIEVKRVSAKQAIYMITQKGVEKEISENAVNALSPDPKQQITELIERKYIRAISDQKGMNRTVAALARKGFSYSDIRAALEKFTNDEWFEE
jgi:regulatory protein